MAPRNHELIHPPTDTQLNFNLLQKKTFFFGLNKQNNSNSLMNRHMMR